MKGKKGDATEIIYFGIIIFFLAIAFIVAIYVNTQISNVISGTALNDSSAAPQILKSLTYIDNNVVQRGYIIMFSMLILAMLVSSFMIRVHPIFIFIYIITLSFSIFLGVYLANLYETLTALPEFAAILAQQTQITFVMQHSIKILIATWALSMIVLFGKLFMPSESGVNYG